MAKAKKEEEEEAKEGENKERRKKEREVKGAVYISNFIRSVYFINI